MLLAAYLLREWQFPKESRLDHFAQDVLETAWLRVSSTFGPSVTIKRSRKNSAAGEQRDKRKDYPYSTLSHLESSSYI